VHTFENTTACHLNNSARVAVSKATVPHFDVGHRTSKMHRRGRCSGRSRGGRNGWEVIEIMPGQYVTASNSGARAISDPARSGVKVASKVACEVQHMN
jgi:hypothetical protein